MGQLQFSPICNGYQVYSEEPEGEKFALHYVHLYEASIPSTGPNKTSSSDSISVIQNLTEEAHFFAIYDGFNPYNSGKDAAKAVNSHLKGYFETNKGTIKTLRSDREVEKFMKLAIAFAEEKLSNEGGDYSLNGTCCIFALIIKNKIHVANLGTSRAVLCRSTPGFCQTIHLSRDNKPSLQDEGNRIIEYGGKIRKLFKDGEFVGEERIWMDQEGPGMVATRGIGGFSFKKIGLISDPEIEHFDLLHLDKFIVMASDGVWDVMDSEEVIKLIEDQPIKEKAATVVAEEARRRWNNLNRIKNGVFVSDNPKATTQQDVDDISVITAFLTFSMNEEKPRRTPRKLPH